MGGIAIRDERLYAVDFNRSTVRVYLLADGSRDTAAEWDLDAANSGARGIALSDTHGFIADIQDNHIYAYLLADGSRDTAAEVGLDSANSNAKGLTIANGSLLVPDNVDRLVYAYGTETRTLESGLNISLASVNTGANGIGFSDGLVYVVDIQTDHVYVYDATIPRVRFSTGPIGFTARTAPLYDFRLLVDWHQNGVFTDEWATSAASAGHSTGAITSPRSTGSPSQAPWRWN